MNCAECEEFELRRDHPWQWMTGRLLLAAFPPRRSPFEGIGAMWSLMLGGNPEPSHYERHREAWAATGDVTELERMLRQVADE